MPKPRVLVLCADRVAGQMAGAAIRSYEIARALAADADVRLAGLPGEGAPPRDVEIVTYELRDGRELEPSLEWADVVIAQQLWPHILRRVVRSGARYVCDLYVPEPLENLEGLKALTPLRRRMVETAVHDKISTSIRAAHHIVCATERQRDLWAGMLVGLGLVGGTLYERDPTLRDTIDVVPFGVATEPAVRRGPGAREAFGDAIGPDDEIVLWNGGIWPWFDTATAIRGVAALRERRPTVKLVFMGAAASGAAKHAVLAARALVDELGLGDHVLFNESWVDYERRADWLLEANCALSTHVDHLETRFAFRTRLLDCFWSRLPVVCTRGDELADAVERDGLGATVPERDAAAVAAALERVLDAGRDAYAPVLAATADRYSWTSVVGPIRRWLADADSGPIGEGAPRDWTASARATAFTGGVTAAARLGLSPFRIAGFED